MWNPMTTAPKDHYILIGDGICWPPDVVAWKPERKARMDEYGTKYHPVPAGWFMCGGGRSRFDPLTKGHLMTATIWCELPAYDTQIKKPRICAGLSLGEEKFTPEHK